MADEVVQEGTIETQPAAGDAAIEDTTKALEAQAAEVAGTESPAPEAAPQQPSTDARFAAKFAALNRKERAANAKVKAAEARLAELEAKIAAAAPVKSAEAPQEDLQTRLLKDPFNTLKAQGLDFETLTKMALDDGRLTPELQMKIMREELRKEMQTEFQEKYGKKIDEYEKRIAAEDAQKQQQAEQQAIGEFKSQIKKEVEADKDSYELLLAEGDEGIDLVYNVIDAHYQETGKVLAKKDAAKFVEAELLEELSKSTKLSKVKKLLEAEVQKTQASGKKPASPTLTNSMAQAQSSGKRFLSDEESRKEAAKLIRWTE